MASALQLAQEKLGVHLHVVPRLLAARLLQGCLSANVHAALSRASPEVTECSHLVLQQQASPAAFIRLRCIAMALHILLGSAKNALLQAVVVCFRPGSSEVWEVLSRQGK